MRKHILIPEKVRQILERMEAAGYEAYAVGGCVRDSLIGRVPDDWDITTSASPSEVKQIFSRTIDTGIAHGTVTVMMGREGFEVTTYRIDGEYRDGRHPASVTFTSELREDLRRRDFTINAMAYHPKTGVIDMFGGMEDMEQGIIRCVGDAGERFSEDALRILRAVRFSAQLGFSIEEQTMAAIKTLAPTLQKISKERIAVELTKLLLSPHPEYFSILEETGITSVIMPEFHSMMLTEQKHSCHIYNVGEHTLEVLKATPQDRTLRWAALLHDVSKPETVTIDEEGITHFYHHCSQGAQKAKEILRRLKFDNDTIDRVGRLVRWHDYSFHFPLERKEIRRAIHKIGADLFPAELELMRADVMGKAPHIRETVLSELSDVMAMYESIMEEKECTCLKELAINGRDLIALGYAPGPELGKVLERLLDEVLEDAGKNHEEYLVERARGMMKE